MENRLPRKIEKPWGFELLFAHTPKYAGKLIFLLEKGIGLAFNIIKRRMKVCTYIKGKP